MESTTGSTLPHAPLRHAIIGLGAGIVSAHLPAIQELDNVVVVGGADVNAATGQAARMNLTVHFIPIIANCWRKYSQILRLS
ncbi:MAG: hypothetical protein R2867_13830 [Caldilineaceae bacterium]